MIILNFLKFLLVFISITYSPQCVTYGMDNVPKNIERGKNTLLNPENKKEFSLSELSFMLRILATINEYCLYEPDKLQSEQTLQHFLLEREEILHNLILQRQGINDIIHLQQEGKTHYLNVLGEQTLQYFNLQRNEVLRNFPSQSEQIMKYFNLQKEHIMQIYSSLFPEVFENIKNSVNVKIKKLFEHFNGLFQRYQNDLFEYFAKNQMDKQTKNEFIYGRINDYGRFLSIEKYLGFLQSFGIEYSEFNENYNFNDEQIDQLFPILQYPSQKELNLLSLYYLYSIVLTLIKSFIQTTAMSYVKFYDQEQLFNRKISIVEYFRLFDIMEVFANNLYNKLQGLYIFKFAETHSLFNLLNTPEITQQNFAITYPVKCFIPDYETGVRMYYYMQSFFTIEKGEGCSITKKEYNGILPYRIENQTTFDLYRLYNFLLNKKKLRAKIEKLINTQLINGLNRYAFSFDIRRDKFDDYEEVEVIIPLRTRQINIPNPIEEGTSETNADEASSSTHQGESSSNHQGESSSSHQDPGPSSGRRRQREGGNGGGNGGSGPRQRGRRNGGGGNGSRSSHGRGRNGGNGNDN